jgi:hypothetical protein
MRFGFFRDCLRGIRAANASSLGTPGHPRLLPRSRLIDTATNKVKKIIYVGRSPHEAFFTPDDAELWVTVRGEEYISVIDVAQMKESAASL